MFLRKTNNILKSLKNIPNEDDVKTPRKEPKPSLRQMFFDIPKSKNKIKNKTKNNTKK